MAQGERRWSTEGREAKKYSFPLLTAGEYELKLLGGESKVGKKTEPGSMPYVGTSYEVLNTATKEGGRNQRLFQNLFVTLKPGKDGGVMPERADQINGLTKATGESVVDFGIVQHPDVEDKAQDCLDAEEIKAWLVAHDGLVVTARLKIEKGKNGYPDKNAIDYFVVEAGAATSTGTSTAPTQTDLFDDAADDYARTGKSTVNGALPPPPPPPKSTPKTSRR